jgi:hypothetical protein
LIESQHYPPQHNGVNVTKSRGIRTRRNPTDSNNLFDVLASRSELIGECLVYMTQSSAERPKVSYNGYMVRAYVAVYLRVHGEVKHNVLHTCNTPRCWNPMHLYDGTKSHNGLDMMEADPLRMSGARSPFAKYSTEYIEFLRNEVASGKTCYRVAQEQKIDRGYIWRVVNGETRKVS